MRPVYLLLANVAFVLATNDSKLENHRFYHNDRASSNIEKESRKNEAGDKDPRNENGGFLNPWSSLKTTDRVQFQIEGHDGPQTYVFGFDTGRGQSRQFRLEERHSDGTVKGQYGYYDAKGKLRTVQYVARPFEGYTEKHHESNVRALKN
ncbi:uncharacterized protein LOC116426542 isoform X2 [Nomia melanderi]|uniref:uncharacterized protein LOC116426542 isoform X2 n=1 Tax=Nomia melanderi TaxID=2448451 RepID=UPI0013041D5F|nr:uncharacterized protein LOC116426542 isoform X2 [Nomia melanderi]